MGLLNKKDGDVRKDNEEPGPRMMGERPIVLDNKPAGKVDNKVDKVEEKPFVKVGDRVTVIHTNGQTGPETVGAVAEYGLLDIGELKQCRHISQGGPRPHWYRDSERETLDQSRERRVK